CSCVASNANHLNVRSCRRRRASLRLRIMGVRRSRRCAERDGGAWLPDRPGWWIFGSVIGSTRRLIGCQREVTDRFDPYPDRVTGEVGDWHLVYLHDLDAVQLDARGDRLANGFGLGRCQDLLPGCGAEREDLVDLAADLRDGGADRIGDGIVAG